MLLTISLLLAVTLCRYAQLLKYLLFEADSSQIVLLLKKIK
jgi:hypothetical protein